MANALYDKGRQAFLEGGIAWLTDTIKAVLVDVTQYGLAVAGASNTTPINLNVNAHGLTTGDRIAVSGVSGNAAANGVWIVTFADANHVTLNGSGGSGAYVSGGYVVKLSSDQFLSDVPVGARVATSGAFTSKTSTFGIANADPITFASVAGATCELVLIYKDTGAAGTSRLIAYLDTMTQLPVTPNGSNIIVQWDTGTYKIFQL